jgi:hypothetical protein
VTAGASAPEHLVEGLVARLRQEGAASVEPLVVKDEDVFFAPPPMPGSRTN